MYSAGCGRSCSMYNPWPVPPDPRGVGRLEEAQAGTGPTTPRRSWMAPEGTAGAGQVVQVAQEPVVAQLPPALREPPTPSRTYFRHQDCVLPHMTAGRPQ